MPFITLLDQNIYYTQAGQGPDVIGLVGWAQPLMMFEATQAHLASRHRVTLLDFPGFGQSEALKTVWDMERYGELLDALVRALQLETPIIIAHSFGARVAAVYASSHPVRKLVLTGAAGLRPKVRWSQRLKRLPYRSVRTVLRMFKLTRLEEALKRRSGSADYRALSGVMRESFVKIVTQDLKAYYQRIDAPTLLIWGERDEATPLWMGQALEILMKDAGLVVFEGADHYAYHHQIHRFHRILDAFLEDNHHA
jgi:pimeloyl-ACP methyl ester carboxylesterase